MPSTSRRMTMPLALTKNVLAGKLPQALRGEDNFQPVQILDRQMKLDPDFRRHGERMIGFEKAPPALILAATVSTPVRPPRRGGT